MLYIHLASPPTNRPAPLEQSLSSCPLYPLVATVSMWLSFFKNPVYLVLIELFNRPIKRLTEMKITADLASNGFIQRFRCFPVLFILCSDFHNVRRALFLTACYSCRVDRHLQTFQRHLVFALSADAGRVPARPSLSLSFPLSPFPSPPPPHDSPYLLAISLSVVLSLPCSDAFFDQCSRVDSCHSGNFARLSSH